MERYVSGGDKWARNQENLVTLYVSHAVHSLSQQVLELLASNTIRFYHRRFHGTTATLLVVEDEDIILEVNYSPLSGITRIKSYQ
jgi:hypothetical protein